LFSAYARKYFMKLDGFRYLLVVLVLVTPLFSQSLNAREELNLGTVAFRHGKNEEAIQHFKNAVALDDQFVNAHLYLGTALATEYIPGAETPENLQLGQQAIDEYKKVLDLSPENHNSILGIASLLFNMKKFDESKEYYRKAIAVDPKDIDSYYAIAVIDWTQAYQAKQDLIATLKLDMGASLIERSECWDLRNNIEESVNEGIEMLHKALSLRPDYDDAMAYLNLMYRERANIQCGDKAAYKADTALADEWVDHAMATRKARAEKTGFSPGGSQPKQ
jgi:tetratricopeptide (TPR) repeat protein